MWSEGLEGRAFAGIQEAQVFAGGLKFSHGCGAVDLDWWESVEMDTQDFVAAEVAGRFYRVVGSHSEIVADRQGAEFKRCGFPDQLHIQRECCVSGVIEVALGCFNNEASRISAVGAVREAAGVDGIDELDAPEWKSECATVVEGMTGGDAVFGKPNRDLKIRYYNGTGALCNGYGVGNVIPVAVRDEYVVRGDLFDVDVARPFIWGDEGIE